MNPTTIPTSPYLWASNIASWSWIFLAYKAHSVVLKSEKSGSDHISWSIGFFFRSVFITILCFLPLLPIFIWQLVQVPEALSILASGKNIRTTIPPTSFLFIPFLLGAVSLLAQFLLLGTYLPAYVAQKNTGLKAAFDRGKRQWWYILWRVVMLIILFFLASIPVLFTVQSFLKGSLPFGEITQAKIQGYQVRLLWINVWLSPISYAINGYITVTIPVILSRAYLRDPSVRLDYNAEA